jgi:hypothetical protein
MNEGGTTAGRRRATVTEAMRRLPGCPRSAHCHRRLPARRLAERVVFPPPKVLGRDTPKDTPARLVVVLSLP